LARWIQPLPQGNDLFAVWIAPWGDVVAVGAGGTIVQSADNGEHWVVRRLGDATLHAVWGPGDDRLYVLGNYGTVYFSQDRGRNFALLNVGTDADLYAMSGRGKDFYIGGADGQLIHSADAGASWQTQHLAPVVGKKKKDVGTFYGPDDIVGVAVGTSDRVVAIANYGGVYVSDDRGGSWRQRRILRWEWGLAPKEGDEAYLMLERVLAYRSDFLILTSEGFPCSRELPSERWCPALRLKGEQLEVWPVHHVVPPVYEPDFSLKMPSYHGLSIDQTGSVFVTSESYGPLVGNERAGELKEMTATDYGVPSDTILSGFNDVVGNQNALFGVSSSGEIARFGDAGKHVRILSGRGEEVQLLWADSTRIMAFGRKGVQITVDRGSSWSEPRKLTSVKDESVRAVWGANGRVYAAGNFGVLRSADGGTTWTPVELPKLADFFPLNGWTPDGESLVIVGDVFDRRKRLPSGVVMQFSNNSWTRVPMVSPPVRGERPVFRAVHGNAEGNIYVVGMAGLMYRSLGGRGFSRVGHFGPKEQLLDVQAGRGTNVWVLVKNTGKLDARLMFSSDAGDHFTEVQSPTHCLSGIAGSADGELVVDACGRLFERAPNSNEWMALTQGTGIAGQLDNLVTLGRRHFVAGHLFSRSILEVLPRQ
jgi:photosystem II stability/assembly factor-like uncharacterized protein